MKLNKIRIKKNMKMMIKINIHSYCQVGTTRQVNNYQKTKKIKINEFKNKHHKKKMHQLTYVIYLIKKKKAQITLTINFKTGHSNIHFFEVSTTLFVYIVTTVSRWFTDVFCRGTTNTLFQVRPTQTRACEVRCQNFHG